jgi:ammonia channel protein AmtB
MTVATSTIYTAPEFGTALVVLCTLVLLMQIGFALIEVGSVRSKNATSILLKNVLGMPTSTST